MKLGKRLRKKLKSLLKGPRKPIAPPTIVFRDKSKYSRKKKHKKRQEERDGY